MAYNSEISDTVESEASAIGAQTASMASFVLIGKLASIIFLGLAFIALARLLGPTGYGIYTLALAVSGVFGSLSNLGISTALNKFIPEHIYNKDKHAIEDLLANSFFVTIVAGIIFSAISFMMSGFIASAVFHNPSYTVFIELASISILSSMLFGASYSALLGFNKGKHIAAITTTQAVLQAVFAVVLVLLGMGPAGPIIGLIIGTSAGFLYSVYLIYIKNHLRMFVKPSLKSIKKIFSFSLPIAASGALQSLSSNISLIVLGAFATAVVVGNFGVASRVNSLIDVISGSISVSLLANYSATLASRKISKKITKMFNYTIYYAVLLLAPILLFIAVLAKPFSYVAFSGVYTLAPLYIAIMAVGTLVGLAGTYASTLFISAKRLKDYMLYNAVISVMQLILLPIIVPLFKGLGLVLLLYAITPIVTNILFIVKSAKLYKLGFDSGKLYRILGANAITMLLIVPLMPLFGGDYIALLIAGAIEVIIVYPIMLGVLKGLTRRDISILERMTRRIPVVSALFGRLLGYSAIFVRAR
ncbi:MAG: oligosaccharide flippase family protein [Candidatus Marsarchaeota archaeon]|nr:oligosaccharide flippase family protein [Candidatus Marsarchaeota archaeon]MCL5115019.1 oligosaccharide flippase family protein [Candidatus Marsarchaeota archaeon]